MYSSLGRRAQKNNPEEDDNDDEEAALLNSLNSSNMFIDDSNNNSINDFSTQHSTLVRSSSLFLDNFTDSSSNFQRDFRQRSPSVYRSHTSLSNTEDPWKASSIGIKCVSYKPIGHVFLTRRVLDTYATDGKRKIDICYNYSKKATSKEKVPSIGTSIKNCSFCDTITLDVEPCAEVYDIVMEVQIITQGASLERHVKIGAVDKDGCPNNQITDDLIESFKESCDDSDADSDSNETTITSNYDFKIRKPNQNYETSLITGDNRNTECIENKNSNSIFNIAINLVSKN